METMHPALCMTPIPFDCEVFVWVGSRFAPLVDSAMHRFVVDTVLAENQRVELPCCQRFNVSRD